MECLDGEGSTRDGEGRGVTEEFRELVPRDKQLEEQEGGSVTFSAFIVADVTISFRSRLLDKTVGVALTLQFKSNVGELTLPQQAHQYVGTERTLVSLIQDDYAVPVEIPFVERLSK